MARAALVETSKSQNDHINDQDSEFEELAEAQSDGPEKDSDEEELERAVFGDEEGFNNQIDDFWEQDRGRRVRDATEAEPLSESGSEDEEDLEGVADDSLFFLDSGPTAAVSQTIVSTLVSDGLEDDDLRQRDPPAWEDSDDERITVSLASIPRLRKLRVTEDEDIIGGKDYIRRLQVQYQRLHPTPRWVDEAYELGSGRKRRRSWTSEDEEDEKMADLDEDMSDENEGDIHVQPLSKLLRNAESFTGAADPSSHKRRKLQPDVLDISRLKDVPGSQKSSVTTISVHPSLPLLLSSGPASTAYLHHLQPTNPTSPNPLLTSLLIKRTPLTTTSFSPDPRDPRIFLSGPNRYFHTWDLNAGLVTKTTRIYGHADSQRTFDTFKLSPDGAFLAFKGSGNRGSGALNVLDSKTMQWIAQIRIESKRGIADFQWWRNGDGICVAGKGGEVTEWSLSEQRVLARWHDEGAVGTTVVALGGKSKNSLGGDRWVVIGSSSGIVNVYDRSEWSQGDKRNEAHGTNDNAGIPSQPKPTKALDQLTTLITHLSIAPDGQLLCMASGWKKDALRLVHLPSCAVYRNWPTSNTPLGKVSSVAWARPDTVGEDATASGTVAVLIVGSEAGRIKMWEIRA